MGKFKRAAVLGATILAFSGAAAGAAQADTPQIQDHKVETPGNVPTDCHSARTQQMLDSAAGRKTVIDYCRQEAVSAGETPTMMVHYHFA